MSIKMDDDLWCDALYARIALARMGDVPENFRIYKAAWVGDYPEWHGMQVTGAEFKRMKRDSSRGKKIPQTDRTVYISRKDLQSANA